MSSTRLSSSKSAEVPRRRAFFLASLAILACTVIPVTAFGAEPELKIGVIIPLSGTMAPSGQAFREAALMAVEDSAAGLPFKVSLTFEDDKLESKLAGTAAQKLIAQNGVHALISTWSYGGSVVSPIAQKAEVLHLSVAWAKSIAEGEFNFLHLMPPAALSLRSSTSLRGRI